MLIAVGVEDDRPLAELLLQTVRIEFRLLLSDTRIPLCPLGFDQPQRFAVVAPQHVIDKALRRVVRHAGDRKFPVLRLVERPTGFVEQQIDEIIAGFRLGIVVVVRPCSVLFLRVSDFDRASRSSSSSSAFLPDSNSASFSSRS